MIEPPVRPDGRCVQCGGERNLDKLAPLYRKALEEDPFCSATCCRSSPG